MKLQADRIDGVNVISGLAADTVSVNGVPHRQSIIVPWQGAVDTWAGSDVAALTVADFERLARMNPELVIFGSGLRLKFPSSALLRPLIERRIGLETMDTAAACRTYNVLVAEGRRAVAALLLG
ncbi:MAG TPA: Mth938-like domain-containing protein [Rhizobacter sp.]|nr:Mth938-like domain-containing protein [Rhizobacter sp.]